MLGIAGDIGGGGHAQLDALERQRLTEQVTLDLEHAGGVAQQDKVAQCRRQVLVVQPQVHVFAVIFQVHAAERVGQVEVAQAHVGGAAQGRATEQGKAPDAVGAEVVALARQ